MTEASPTQTTSTFTLFPLLPTELRLKIWSHYQALTPPSLIPFHIRKSDLDYLRLKRKACNDYAHVFARKMQRVPPILHVCRESRDVGLQHYSVSFDISRLLSTGKGDTDIDTYTTCSHEVALDELDRGIYWDREKDVVFLDESGWAEYEAAVYVWGGKTGVRFGKMRKVAMSYDTLMSCGIGEYLGWEGIDLLLVLIPEHMSREDLKEDARWTWGNRRMNAEGYLQVMLGSRGLHSIGGEGVEVKFDFESVREVMDFVTARGS